MTGTLASPRWPWIPIALGIYAALLAVLPDSARLGLIAPLPIVALAWWILSGPADRWLLAFLCAAALLPPLPIALGDSGPHPSLVLAGMGALVGLIRLKDWRVPTTGLARAMIVLFFLLTLSLVPAALYSGLPVAFASLARVLLFGISVYVFFYVTSGPEYPVRAFQTVQVLFIAAAVAAMFACVDFYYQFPAPAGFGPQFVWLDTGVFRRAQGLFYEASTLGNFCAFFLVLVAVALTWPGKRPPLSRPLLLTGAAIISPALVLSFSRASLINVVVAIAALIWLRRGQMGFRRIGLGLLVAAVVGAVATHYFLPAFTELYWNRLSTSTTYLFSSTEAVLSGRLSSWQVLADFLRENPLHGLFGIGYKTLPYSTFIGQAVVGDNMYLTMLVETGVVGLAAFLVLNFSILRLSYRAAARSDLRGSFFGTWIFCFWMGQMVQMLSGDLFTYWRVLPFYFWALAVAARPPMNILFLDQFSDLGGAQRCLVDLAPALLERGWPVHVAAPGNGELRDRIEALGGSYHKIHARHYQSGGKSIQDLLRFPIELPVLSREIGRLAEKYGADIIYVNGPRLLPAAALAARVPLIFHSHSYLRHGYAAALAGIALANSDAALIANCHYVVEPLRPFLSSTRIDVVYNGVEGQARNHRPPGTRRIGVIGRIAPEKGQLEFVEMARELPRTFQFVVCGAPLFSDASYAERVRRTAEGLDIEFMGWRDDVNAVLSTLDLLVVPSTQYEATTRVILEAFAAGVPVIAPNCGGIPEIVSDGETGFLSPVSRFPAKVSEVMKEPALLAKVADNAYEAWKERFTLAHYQARILSILERTRA